jgi:hypothetical protein
MRKLQLILKMFLLLSAVYLAIGLVSGLIFYFFMPHYYFKLYPAIVVFYWISGVLLNFLLEKNRHKKPDVVLNVYMMGRMIKFLFTIVFLLIYVLSGGPYKGPFAIVLMCNYFIYTGLELYIYYLYTKLERNHAK